MRHARLVSETRYRLGATLRYNLIPYMCTEEGTVPPFSRRFWTLFRRYPKICPLADVYFTG